MTREWCQYRWLGKFLVKLGVVRYETLTTFLDKKARMEARAQDMNDKTKSVKALCRLLLKLRVFKEMHMVHASLYGASFWLGEREGHVGVPLPSGAVTYLKRWGNKRD